MNSTRHPDPAGPSSPARRRLLRRASAAAAAAFGAGLAGPLALMGGPARAADYRALVCVFLYGGNDGMNTVVPNDTSRHGQYSGVRGALAIPRSSLLGLSGVSYGLHPSLSALQPFWGRGQLVPVFNVGPLARPITQADYLAASDSDGSVPQNLFSHADQQTLWECAGADTFTRTGWGGRGSGALATANPVISVGGNGRFGVEELRSPLVIPGPGDNFGASGLMSDDTWTPNVLKRAALDALYAQPQGPAIATAYTEQQAVAFEVSERLDEIVASVPGDALSSSAIDNAFAPLIVGTEVTTDLGRQLYQVAKLIRDRSTVLGDRQIFFAQQDGYDTHSDQIDGSATAGLHADKLKELGDALACFQQAMVNLGLAGAVTTFTQSDFGRTFAPNASNGTDHAWGNHHLVLGGAVKGKATYGTHPTLTLGGPDDTGVNDWDRHGRWIPTSSVDQYAATLLGWWGASSAQLDLILPNLANFGSRRSLGFL
jgi:uncharacterized protein (DUF1501 family)